MFGYEFFYSYWWVFPLAMIIFCIFFMSRGCGKMMHGCCSHAGNASHNSKGEPGQEILDRRFAQGEINEAEYEEKKRKLTQK